MPWLLSGGPISMDAAPGMCVLQLGAIVLRLPAESAVMRDIVVEFDLRVGDTTTAFIETVGVRLGNTC